ncbi:hypothetical protein IAT38_005573 [Cryptococcus sp. DSM 104549]
MPRQADVASSIYLDEAEGFILEHAIVPSPPRSWRPAPPPAPAPQAERLAEKRKKMDWAEEVRAHPDEPMDESYWKKPKKGKGVDNEAEGDEDADSERCAICLMALRDRAIAGVCGHEFCFECIGVWANQSRRCPLCSADMAPFILHDLDSSTPTKFYLPPLPSTQVANPSLPGPSRARLPTRQDSRRWGEREKVEPDELDLQVERRREIYVHGLYAKHIGSNRNSGFRPNPTPRQLSEDQILIQRATAFMRRELRVWSHLDVEFLTNYILSLLKAIDVRSEPAIRLLSDFLECEEFPSGPEHFAHELYSFLRSPYRELRRYDEIAQYDKVPVSQPKRSLSPSSPLSSRSRSRSRSRSLSRSPSRSLSPYSSRSPSPYSSRSPSPYRSRSPASPRRPRSRSFSPRRDFTQADTYRAPPSPNARRWDEADTWLDPEYSQYLAEQKAKREKRSDRWRKKEERRAERRLERAHFANDQRLLMRQRQQQVMEAQRRGAEIQDERPQYGMRAWMPHVGEQEGVELFPVKVEPGSVKQEPIDVDEGPGLAEDEPIDVDARPSPPPTSVPPLLMGRSILGAAGRPQTPAAGSSQTGFSIRGAAGQGKPAFRSPPPASNPSTGPKLSLRERLAIARAKVNAQPPPFTPSRSSTGYPTTLTPIPTPAPTATPNPALAAAPTPLARERANPQARLQLRLKLERERAALRKTLAAEGESKAAELRLKLVEAKIAREKEAAEAVDAADAPAPPPPITPASAGVTSATPIPNAFKPTAETSVGLDQVLNKRDDEERKKEVRRRLMVAKMMEAETDGERKTRELKAKLLARKQSQAQAKLAGAEGTEGIQGTSGAIIAN